MNKKEGLLDNFGDMYLNLKKKKYFRYLIISIIGIIIIIIIIVIIAVSAKNKNKSNKKNNNDNDEIYGSCPEIKYISSDYKGNGFASRYWDCCKPSCSWTENAGSGNEARQCDKNMNIINDKSSINKCDGGPSTTCLSQIPFVINGCDNLGFAFAAAPGGSGNICGKCFELKFTGSGKYETQKNHQMLKDKKLIVMASNIGYDVAGGQFDVMIPGGGVGIYNGCNDILGTNLGEKYGGFLSDCEKEIGWNVGEDTLYNGRKECLTKKCNSIFSNNDKAKKGCLFLADFLEAAGNPLHSFREIECPQVLKDRY